MEIKVKSDEKINFSKILLLQPKLSKQLPITILFYKSPF